MSAGDTGVNPAKRIAGRMMLGVSLPALFRIKVAELATDRGTGYRPPSCRAQAVRSNPGHRTALGIKSGQVASGRSPLHLPMFMIYVLARKQPPLEVLGRFDSPHRTAVGSDRLHRRAHRPTKW